MLYAIFTCTYTLEMGNKYGGKFGVYVPVDKEMQKGKPNHYVLKAALPGFAFVPRDTYKSFQRVVESKYAARPLYTKIGNPYYVEEQELRDLQQRISDSHKVQPNSNVFNVGDKVEIRFHKLQETTFIGRIVKFRRNKRARILLDKKHQYVEVPLFLLKLCLQSAKK